MGLNMITKFDKYNESVRDLMTPKSKEEVGKLLKKSTIDKGYDDGYTKEEAKSIIRRYSKRLNDSFKDDTERRVVEWLYEWRLLRKDQDEDFPLMNLSLSSYRGKYNIDFIDNREHSWKKIKNTFSMDTLYPKDFHFREEYYYLEHALDFLKDCNIDVSKITRK